MSANKFTETHDKLSEADMKAAEKRMGFKLPTELRRHYFMYNGGEPERRCWKGRRYEDNYLTIFFPIRKVSDLNSKKMTKVETLDEAVVDLLDRKQIPESFIPFADDSGGNYFCLDRKTGKIYFFIMDEDSDFKSRQRYLAPSLKEFIEGLVKGDNEYL